MFIQTQETPNPETLKFIPGVIILEGKSFTVSKKDYEKGSLNYSSKIPLMAELFSIDGIESVFIASDFISITKSLDKDWNQVKTLILSAIMDFFLRNGPIIVKEGVQQVHGDNTAEEDEIVRQIKDIIEENVRPAVAQDGGDIVFVKYDKGIVYVELMGACSGCPSSKITLKSGIENMLKYYVPEIEAVEDINENGLEHAS